MSLWDTDCEDVTPLLPEQVELEAFSPATDILEYQAEICLLDSGFKSFARTLGVTESLHQSIQTFIELVPARDSFLSDILLPKMKDLLQKDIQNRSALQHSLFRIFDLSTSLNATLDRSQAGGGLGTPQSTSSTDYSLNDRANLLLSSISVISSLQCHSLELFREHAPDILALGGEKASDFNRQLEELEVALFDVQKKIELQEKENKEHLSTIEALDQRRVILEREQQELQKQLQQVSAQTQQLSVDSDPGLFKQISNKQDQINGRLLSLSIEIESLRSKSSILLAQSQNSQQGVILSSLRGQQQRLEKDTEEVRQNAAKLQTASGVSQAVFLDVLRCSRAILRVVKDSTCIYQPIVSNLSLLYSLFSPSTLLIEKSAYSVERTVALNSLTTKSQLLKSARIFLDRFSFLSIKSNQQSLFLEHSLTSGPQKLLASDTPKEAQDVPDIDFNPSGFTPLIIGQSEVEDQKGRLKHVQPISRPLPTSADTNAPWNVSLRRPTNSQAQRDPHTSEATSQGSSPWGEQVVRKRPPIDIKQAPIVVPDSSCPWGERKQFKVPLRENKEQPRETCAQTTPWGDLVNRKRVNPTKEPTTGK
jgi:hypothetical protein